MSLLQRMERAQQARAAEAAAASGAAAPTPPVETNGTGPDHGVSVATALVAPPAEPTTGETPLVAVGPAPLTGLMKPGPAPVRDDLIREVRIRLQTEVVNAFKTLLDAKEEEVRGKIESLVDRVIAKGGFAVTREERGRASSRRWSTTSPASGRSSRCSPTRPSRR